MSKVTLYIPGLFHFIPEFEEDELTDLTSLRSFLSFGRAKSIDSLPYLEQVADFFGIENQDDADVPYAALSRLVDETSRPRGSWMRVDPVHLKTTPKGLVLIDSRQFSLSQHDSLALASILNEKFKTLNCHLEVPVADRWYLQLPNTPSIKTNPIHSAAGQSISEFMLQGEQKEQWLKLFNEIQMLLHDCSVNEQRQAKGEPAINSLWFWGLGELPNSLERCWSNVVSDDLIVKGLCMLSSTVHTVLDECRIEELEEKLSGDNLFILSEAQQSVQYDEPFGWLESVRLIESQWLKPMLRHLKNGTVSNLEIVTEGYQLNAKRSSFKQFWKRRKPLKSFFN